jgi:hypothetical protein
LAELRARFSGLAIGLADIPQDFTSLKETDRGVVAFFLGSVESNAVGAVVAEHALAHTCFTVSISIVPVTNKVFFVLNRGAGRGGTAKSRAAKLSVVQTLQREITSQIHQTPHIKAGRTQLLVLGQNSA